MKIDNMEVGKSAASPGERYLKIESGGYTFLGYFDDLLSFFKAVGDAMKYFGQAGKLIAVAKDGTVSSLVKR